MSSGKVAASKASRGYVPHVVWTVRLLGMNLGERKSPSNNSDIRERCSVR